MVRLTIDFTRCEGYGICATTAPDLVELGDDGLARVTREDLRAADIGDTEAAAENFPLAVPKVER